MRNNNQFSHQSKNKAGFKKNAVIIPYNCESTETFLQSITIGEVGRCENWWQYYSSILCGQGQSKSLLLTHCLLFKIYKICITMTIGATEQTRVLRNFCSCSVIPNKNSTSKILNKIGIILFNEKFRFIFVCQNFNLRWRYLALIMSSFFVCLLLMNLFFIYLFLAVLGLRCCARVFSSCGERWLPFLAVRGLLIAVASLIVEHKLQARGLQQLWYTGLVVPRHMGSTRTRDRTRVPCIGRRILNHCTTREVPDHEF